MRQVDAMVTATANSCLKCQGCHGMLLPCSVAAHITGPLAPGVVRRWETPRASSSCCCASGLFYTCEVQTWQVYSSAACTPLVGVGFMLVPTVPTGCIAITAWLANGNVPGKLRHRSCIDRSEAAMLALLWVRAELVLMHALEASSCNLLLVACTGLHTL